MQFFPVRWTSFLWGPDCHSQWRRACGRTEEELAPRRAPGAGAGGQACGPCGVPQPPGCALLEFVLDLLSCRSWLTGATPFLPSRATWQPMTVMPAGGRPLSQPEQRTRLVNPEL